MLPRASWTTNSRTCQMQTISSVFSSRTFTNCGSRLDSRRGYGDFYLSLPFSIPVHGMESTKLVFCAVLLSILPHPNCPIDYSHCGIVTNNLLSIQYGRFFGKKYILDSVYLLVSELYFIVGIFVSHYVYKRFKNHSSGGALLPNNPPPENGPGRAPR